ncbi:MAG: uracil-DNA glycosylase family protein [Acetobacterales bacterium]
MHRLNLLAALGSRVQQPRSPGEAEQRLLERTVAEARACEQCSLSLPLEPRPVLRASVTARLLVVGPPPERQAHRTGVPYNDPTGDTLRNWLGLDRYAFYDEKRVAILPLGFCFPGHASNGNLQPARPECTPAWHPRIRALLPNVELTLLAGGAAQSFYLGARALPTMTQMIEAWRDYLPDCFPVPNPAWRSARWLSRNPWFTDEALPELRRRVQAAIVKPVPKLLPLHRLLPAQRHREMARDPDDWIE